MGILGMVMVPIGVPTGAAMGMDGTAMGMDGAAMGMAAMGMDGAAMGMDGAAMGMDGAASPGVVACRKNEWHTALTSTGDMAAQHNTPDIAHMWHLRNLTMKGTSSLNTNNHATHTSSDTMKQQQLHSLT